MTAPVVVLGDVMLDIDRIGAAQRLSPEAPVPVLDGLRDHRRPGGAALAALLAARGGDVPVTLIAPFADDAAAEQISRLLAGRVQVIPLPWTGSTPVKTRIRAGDHPIARLDEGGRPGSITSIPDGAVAALETAAAVLVADYGGGATTDPRLRDLIASCAGRVPVLWDPHPRGATPVAGCILVTPNESELRQLMGAGQTTAAGSAPIRSTIGELRDAVRHLSRQWQVGGICVTLGSRGAVLCLGDNAAFMVPGVPVSGGDTCGAGDSFAAAATCALARGALPSEAVTRAVANAGEFVAAGGAAGLQWDAEPSAGAPHGRSVVDLVDSVRRAGGVVVATGGCFDLLHAGHVATLESARALGDALIVCLNSDASVRRLKGEQRPLQTAPDRARVLSALAAVDAVVSFEEDTPTSVLNEIRPDIWVKGGDYSGLELPEAAVLAEWGGQVVTVPYLAGRSTSALVGLAAPLVAQP
jgi:rfaE bifunctional protein nucleotidyltransferase chain/domain/rfaE bifunctional protein kinase chain/domain